MPILKKSERIQINELMICHKNRKTENKTKTKNKPSINLVDGKK